MSAATIPAEAIWHDVECGAYAADLALWSAIAGESAGPVLELGAGTGRVALELAREGHSVTALDVSPVLLEELARRACEQGLEVETILADARTLRVAHRYAAIVAPMQFVHLLGGKAGRATALAAAAVHLDPAGVVAAAVLGDDAMGAAAAHSDPPLPDVRELDGWIYSSLPVEVRAIESAIEVRRLRQLVSPDGELSEELDAVRLDRLSAQRLEAEAIAVGLRPRERIEVSPTSDHLGSVVCVLEAG